MNEFCCRLKTDTYFGSFHGVRGYNDPNILIQRNGSSYLFQPAGGTNFILPFHVTNSCNYNAYGYYSRTNLPYYHALADAYTICDAKFSSFPGPDFSQSRFSFFRHE